MLRAMFAMVLNPPGAPLVAEVCADPEPGPGEVRLRIRACGVCRTDLHIVDGELTPRMAATIPRHENVGGVDTPGAGGGVWVGGTGGCGHYCREAQETLCDEPSFTGWTRDGGYADTAVVRSDYTFPIPDSLSDLEAAPLMCPGLIGYL